MFLRSCLPPPARSARTPPLTPDITYVASILCTSLERRYLITNASWIAGAALTIFLDLFVLGQFAFYSHQDAQRGKVFADDDEA